MRNIRRKTFTQIDNDNSLYFYARYGRWQIGKTTAFQSGSLSTGVVLNSSAVCVEETKDGKWLEWDDSQWFESRSVEIKCLDESFKFLYRSDK